MKVIQYVDPTGQTMVARVPRQGTAAIKLAVSWSSREPAGGLLRTAASHLRSRDGKALDTFGPGRHTLATQNLPFLTKLLGIPFEGKSPFQAAVVFVSTKTFLDLKWGTKEPVAYRDSELAMVRLRAFGKFAVRITNSQLFVNTSRRDQRCLHHRWCGVVLQRCDRGSSDRCLGENLQSIFDLPKVYDELGMALKSRVADDFSKYGIELVDMYLGAITPPNEVQKLIDERAGMAAVGDMNAYMKFKAAKAMGDAAQNTGGETGGGVGAGLGVGMGAGMGMMLPQMMKEAMQDQGGQPAPAGGGGESPAAPPAQDSGSGAAAAGAAAALARRSVISVVASCRKRRNSALPAVRRWAARQTGFEVDSSRPEESGSSVLCSQCGGKNEVPTGHRFVTCVFCDTTLFVDRAQVVFHYRLPPLLAEEEATAALRRWMAGNDTVKDLDRKAASRVSRPSLSLSGCFALPNLEPRGCSSSPRHRLRFPR